MNIESMANYADVIGGIAVIVSLIYVGVQIRRNTKSSQSQANQSAHESLANVSLEVAKDRDFSNLTRKGMIAFEELTEEEKFQFLLLMVTVFRRFENVFYQYKKGFLEKELWEGYKQSMLLYFYTSGGQAFWNVRGAHFSGLFREYLDSTSPGDAKSEIET
ncbi:MAG: hypothetical protein GWP63_18170 [Haliea sp.]|jgi:hypothetical protein|nr:hypothetical protein [Haliea sp.]